MNSNTNKAATPCKVVLLGESGKYLNITLGVGKSSIISRYINDTFQNNNMSTTGASFAAKSMFFDQFDRNLKFEVYKFYNPRSGIQPGRRSTDLSQKYFIKTRQWLY
jgi:hypothetical protein